MAQIIPFTNGRCSAPARSTAPTVAPVTHRQAGAAPPFKQWLDPADLARATRDGGMEAAIEERLNRPDLYDSLRRASTDQRDYDTDLRIIGWGLAAAALWVVCFRLGQLAGMLS